jgi:hypothetical protein
MICPSRSRLSRVGAKQKLTDEQVKMIRRRVRKREPLTRLAVEYGVNRKTLRRRLDALEQAEAEQAAHLSAKRLRWQAKRERLKLAGRDRIHQPAETETDRLTARLRPAEQAPRRDAHEAWLDIPKNLSGRALAEATGLVRLRNPDGSISAWVERPDVDARLDEGWTMA